MERWRPRRDRSHTLTSETWLLGVRTFSSLYAAAILVFSQNLKRNYIYRGAKLFKFQLYSTFLHSICLFEHFKMVYFSKLFFSDHKKKTLEYIHSLWFLSKFDETMTSPKHCKMDFIQKPFLKGAEWRFVASSSAE